MEEQLKQQINDTISYIDQYCKLIMLGKYDYAKQYMVVLTSSFKTVIPEIIKSYSDSDVLTDKDSYKWVTLLGRILDALSSDDDFKKIDILMIETTQELTKYMEYWEQE